LQTRRHQKHIVEDTKILEDLTHKIKKVMVKTIPRSALLSCLQRVVYRELTV